MTHKEYLKKKNINKPEDISSYKNMGNENDFTYEKYKQMKDNGQVYYNPEVVKNYFSQAQGLFNEYNNNHENPSYEWANKGKDYVDEISRLSGDERYVNMYLDSIKDKPEYEQLSKQFSDYRTALTQTKDYLNSLYGLASQYDNEDDYNSAMTEINRQQKYKDYSYDDIIKASNESEDEDEAEWLKSYANDKVSLEEIKGKRDKTIARQNEVNAQINEYMDKERAAFSTEEKQKYAALLDPLYKESDELKKQLIDYNPVYEQKQAQANAAEWETKYKGLNYGELLSEIRDEKSTAEKKWLQDKADEVATSEDYQSQIDELKARQEAEHSNWGGSNEYSGDITELENKLKLKQRAEKAAEYETLVNSPDFADNNSMEWNHIGANDMLTYMNDEEKQVYSYLHNTGREDEAEEYSKLIQPRLTERYTQTVNEWAQQYATEHPWLASGLSLGSNLISGAGIVEDIGKRIVGEPIDVNSPMHYGANMTNALRSTVSDKYLGDVGTFGYDTVMSAADSAINMAVSTAIGGAVGAVGSMSTAAVESLTATVSSTIMGSQVATNTVIDAKERGLSDDQAVTLGVLYGVVEGLSEKWSIERFIHDPTSIGSALRKAAIAEGTEEIAANWGDRIVDALVTGDKNKVSEQYQNYIKQGFSDKEALTMTLYNMVGEDASAFLAGGLSGVAMSGTHMALAGGVNKAQEIKFDHDVANEIRDNKEGLDKLVKDAKALDEDSDGFKLAEQVENKIEKGEKVKLKEVNKLLDYVDENNAQKEQEQLDSITKNLSDEQKGFVVYIADKLDKSQTLTNKENELIHGNKDILNAIAYLRNEKAEETLELMDAAKYKSNLKYYKSNGNGLIEVDGNEYKGTVEIKSTDPKSGHMELRLTSPDNTVKIVNTRDTDIDFRSDAERTLFAAASTYKNVDEANALVENYEGGDVDSYLNDWNLFSNYGRLGYNRDQIAQRINENADTPARRAAYYYGMESFKSSAQSQYIVDKAFEAKTEGYTYQKGSFTNSISQKAKLNLNKSQRQFIGFGKLLSRVTPLNVEIFESKVNDKDNFEGEQGSYNRATKTLRIDVNAGYQNSTQAIENAVRHGMFLTAGHELTHVAEQGKSYMKVRAEIIRTLDNAGFNYKELVDKKVNELRHNDKYKGIGTDELYRLADTEALADCCETMLQNSKLLEKLATEDYNLAEKLINAIKKAIENLRNFFKENPLEAKTEYGQALLEAMNKVENRVQELWDKAVAEGIRADKAENRNNTTQFSIRIDIDGNKYVDVDQSIYDNTDGQSIAAVIAKIISTRFHNLISVNGQKIQINKTTNDEWRMSKSARFLQKTDTQAYNDKLRSIANADEILKVANNWVGEKLTHKRTDNIIEFARGNLLYKVGDNGYIADVIVGTKDNGAAVLYDIKNIYSKKITEAPRVTKGESESNSLRTPSASVNDTIPQSTSKINTPDESSSDRFNDSDYLSAVERGDMATAQKMVDEAAERAFNNSKIRDDSGRLIKVYHGTEDDFTVFDKTKGRANMDIQGMFFSPWELDAQGYGSNVRAFYLNITNPASESVGYKALNNHKGENNAGIKAREDLVRMGYDGVNNSDEEYIAFNSSQIKSADPVTYDDDGNVIPLSERFNEDKEDIRYSDRTDPDYFDELFDMGEDLFEDESKRQTLNELIDKYPDDALSIIKHAAEQTIENVLTKTKSIKLSDKAYLSIAQKFMQDYNISRAANPGEDAYLVSQLKNIVARVEAGELTTGEDVVNEIIEVARDALMLGGTLDDSLKEERDFVLGLLKGKTLIVTDYNESDIRENYGDLKRYRAKLGHGYIALERNAKKKLGGVQGVYINEIITEVQQAYPSLVDDEASEATGFSWLERLMNDKLEPTFKADTTSTPEIDAVNAGFEIIENLLDRKARQIVNAKGGQKYVLLGNSAKEMAQEQRKAIREAVSKAKEKERHKSKEALKKQRDKFNEKIREAKTTERAKAKEALDKQRQKTREVRQNKNKLIIAEKEKRNNGLRKLRDSYAKKEELRKANNLYSKLKQMLLHPTDTAYIPEQYKNLAIEALDAWVQAIKLSDDTKVGQSLDKLSKLIRELATNIETKDVYASEFDEIFRENVQAFIDTIKDKKINRDLTVRDAQEIYRLFSAVMTTIRQANKFIDSNERRSIYEAGLQIMNEQKALDVKWINKHFNAAKKYFMTPVRMGLIINGYNDNAVLVKLTDELNIGRRKKDFFGMTANKMFDDYRAEHVKELDNTEKNVRTIHWKDNSGTERTTDMTGMQAMQIVMTWNREVADENLVHISEGGLAIFDPKLLAKGKTKEAMIKAKKLYGINQSFITAVASSLTDFEKGYIDIAETFFNEYAKEAINETSQKLHHIKIANSRYYIPIKVDQNALVKEIDGVKYDSSVENKGIFKPVAVKSKKTIYIQGLDSLINGHIEEVSDYFGLAIPIRNFNKVLNANNNEYGENAQGETITIKEESVRSVLNDNWGELAKDNYEQMLTDLQQARVNRSEQNSKELKKYVHFFRSNFVTSVLNFNPSVTLKQAASYLTAGVYLSPSSLAKGLAWFTRYKGLHKLKALYDEIDTYTAQHYIRRQGLSSNEIADMNNNWLSKAMQNTGVGRKLSTSKLAQKIPSGFNPNKWIQNMDCLTTAMLWVATKEQVNRDFNKANKEIDTAEYWQAVTDLYDKVIEDTQPMYDSLHRPEALKTTNEWWKTVFMFKTQPLQNAGIIYDALGRAAQGNKGAVKQLGKAVLSQGGSLVVFALMTWLVSMIRRNPKRYLDENGEFTVSSNLWQISEDIFTNGMGILLPLGGSEIVTLFTQNGDAVQDNLAAQINDYRDSAKKLYEVVTKHNDALSMGLETEPEEIISAVKDFVIYTAQNVTGMPVKNAVTNFNSVIGWINEGLFDGDSQFSTTENQSKKQIAGSYVKRLESGNSAEAQQILTDLYNQELETAKADPNVKNPETKAQGAVREMLVDAYQTEYQEAFLRNDDKEMRRIAQIFISAKRYMTWNNGKTSLDNKLEEWRKTAKETIQKKY